MNQLKRGARVSQFGHGRHDRLSEELATAGGVLGGFEDDGATGRHGCRHLADHGERWGIPGADDEGWAEGLAQDDHRPGMVKGLRFTKLFRFSNSSADSVTQCTGNQAGGADRNPGVDAVLEGDFFALRIEGRGYLRQELKAVREFDVFKFPGP